MPPARWQNLALLLRQTLSFDEFVDLFSVFSARAPKDEKIKVAFRMYDFDDNGFIDPVDLEMVIETMLKLADDDDKERLSEEERICIIQKAKLPNTNAVR